MKQRILTEKKQNHKYKKLAQWCPKVLGSSVWYQMSVRKRMVRGTAMPICTFEALTWKEKN